MKFFVLLISIFFAACQSQPKPLAVEAPPMPVVSDEKPAVPPDQPIQPRFCKDDVYTQYIREEYLKANRIPNALGHAHEESFKALRYQLPLEFAGAPIEPSVAVLSWISYFTGRGRSEFLLWLVRSASFRDALQPLLEKEGLPPEFLYLAMIESGLSNYAYSRARASGAWQFMKPTAESYGLAVNYWIDERRDHSKSTLAAARYLKDLHQQFGDWYLALAAYNAGPGKVLRAMKSANSRDYWTLVKTPLLRPETKNYVPKLLAALIVASHASTYGFDIVADVRNRVPQAKVSLQNAYSMSEIATKLGVPESSLARWNPELLQAVTPPLHPDLRPRYELRIPAALVSRFTSIEPELERLALSDVKVHKIRKGDTLASIARLYKISARKIIEMNPAVKPQRLRPGQSLTVPVPSVQRNSLQARLP